MHTVPDKTHCDWCFVGDRWFKGVITCLKCQRHLTHFRTFVKFQKAQRVIGILCLWDNVLIDTPTLSFAERTHLGLWGSHPPDWFRHRQRSIITLLYSAALPVRQHKRHIRAAHEERTLERGRRREEERRGEERVPHSCGGLLLLSGRCAVSLCLAHMKVKDCGEVCSSAAAHCKRQINSYDRNASSSRRSIAAQWLACSLIASTLRWQIIDSCLVWPGAPYDYEIWPNDLIRWRLV